MKKVKLFYDVINEMPKWLNNIASKGYRLKKVYNCVYAFEETDKCCGQAFL